MCDQAHAYCLRLFLCAMMAGSLLSAAEPDPATSQVSFYRDVRPILQANCIGCHQPAKPSGELVLTDVPSLLAGGESGGAVEPGEPDASYLMEQVTPVDGEVVMPPEGAPLSDAERSILRLWIERGAVDDTPANVVTHYDQEHLPRYHVPPLITSIDYSPDGSLLAVAGFHEVLLHNLETANIEGRLVGYSERIERVRFSPDGKRLAVAGGLPARMGELQIWNLQNQELELSIPAGFDTIYGASWSPDGRLVAFGTPQNMLIGIDTETGQQVLLMRGHTDWVLDTVFSPQGDHLVSVGRDMTAKLTRVSTQQFLDNITSITPGALVGGIHAVARHPSRDEILVGGADGVPQIYRLHRETARQIGDNANLVRRFPRVSGRIWSVAYDASGSRIATASALDGQGFVDIDSSDFDPAIPDLVRKALDKVASSRSPEEHAAVEAYVTQGVKRLHGITIAESECYAVAFHPSGAHLAVAGADGRIRLIRTDTGTIEREFLAVPVEPAAPAAALVADQTSAINLKKGLAAESKPVVCEDGSVVDITITPDVCQLRGPYAYEQLLVTARLSDGQMIDVTREVTWEVEPESAVSIRPGGLLRVHPVSRVSTGQSQAAVSADVEIRARWQSHSASATVRVADLESTAPPDFVRDISPVISRLGCNAGTCHGAKDGKNGFKLSLRGYDPVFDLRALAGDHASRRLNVSSPDDSLALLKATASVPHQGGMVTERGSDYYRQLRAWIASGARLDRNSKRPERIEILPANPVLAAADAQQQFRTVAHYADGISRDVTRESFIESGNTEVATHDDFGLITAVRRGEAPILARFEGCYAATILTVMGDRRGFQWAPPPSWGTIDDLVARKWERLKIEPSPLCTDTEFLRRVYLDLTGLPPTSEQVLAFVDDPRPQQQKRDEVIDQMVGSPQFIDYWSNKWADLLQVHGRYLGSEGAERFRNWIRQQLKDNVPYDQFVYQILTAKGSTYENPAASYYKVLRTPAAILENTTHLFLATRFNCNKCHDHPFERWTQDQYYETGAFFAQVSLQADDQHSEGKRIGGSAVEGDQPLFEFVEDATSGEFTHERTGQAMTPVFPYETAFECAGDASRREQMARWLTSPDNRYFATSYVNRLWAYLMGVGIIEPIDDIRAGNPPTNPELLDYLGDEFVSSGFDVRHMLRLICKSRTYQLSITTNPWNEDDRQNFSRATARRLPAEVLLDSVYYVAGATPRIPGAAAGTRAVQLADGQIDVASGLLANLGRPARESACECERVNDVHLGAVMGLLNGPEIAAAISDPQNELARLAQREPDDRALIEQVFLRVLNRPAREPEIDAVLQSWQQIPDDHERLVKMLAASESAWTLRKDTLVRERLERIRQTEADLAAYLPEHEKWKAESEADQQQRIAAAQTALDGRRTQIPDLAAKWEKALHVESLWTHWRLLAPQKADTTGGIQLAVQPDGSLLASGGLVACNYLLETTLPAIQITGVAVQALPHDDLPGFGPGLHPNGNFVVSEVELAWRADGPDAKEEPLQLVDAQVDYIQQDFDIKRTVNGKKERDDMAWAVEGAQRRPHLARFRLAEPFHRDQPGTLVMRIYCQYGNGDYPLACFRLWTTRSIRPLAAGIQADIANVVTTPPEQRTAEQLQVLHELIANQDEQYLSLRQNLAKEKRPLSPDARLVELQQALEIAKQPIVDEPAIVRLRHDVEQSAEQMTQQRLTAVQDLAWALINTSEFLFNH